MNILTINTMRKSSFLLIMMVIPFWLLSQDKSTFLIKGTVDETLQIDSIPVQYAFEFQQQITETLRHRAVAPVENNRFLAKIDSCPSLFHIFLFNREDVIMLRNPPLNRLVSLSLAVAPSLDFEIQIAPDTVTVKGKDADPIECQLKLGELLRVSSRNLLNIYRSLEIDSTLEDSLTSNRLMSAFLALRYEKMNNTLDSGMKLIESYRKHRSDRIWTQIKFDWYGLVNQNLIIYPNARYDLGSPIYRPSIIEHYREFFLSERPKSPGEKYDVESFPYGQFLANKAFSDLRFSMAVVDQNITPHFSNIIYLLSERYEGNEFEQAAFARFFVTHARPDFEESQYSKLKSLIENRKYIDYIEKMRSVKASKQAGYPFRLRDNLGQLRTSKEFEGKALIIDFWYTGCPGCRVLYERMKPIKDHFKGDSSVVFLSISIDSTKERWLNSIDEGKYTDADHVNLWVGNEGAKAKIIEHYNIWSYPTLLILNGRNEIVAYNPVRPNTELNTKILKGLIYKASEM
ncbi:MAG: TlpA family protein disulfide reductase [Sphingobacterium sp.]